MATLEERVAALEKQSKMGGLGDPNPDQQTVDAVNRQNAVIGSMMADAVTGRLLKGPLRIGNVNVREGAITADKITVEVLSALTVDAGELEAGTITGLLIRTSVDGARVAMSGETYGGLIGYGAADTYDPVTGVGTYQIFWDKADGKFYFADGKGILTDTGIEFKDDTEQARILWNFNATRRGQISGYASAAVGYLVFESLYDSDNRADLYASASINNSAILGSIREAGNSHTLAVPGVIMKLNDEVVSNSVTLQSDEHLKIYLPSQAEVAFELFIVFTSTAAADFKLGWSVPAGCIMDYLSITDIATSLCDETTVTTYGGSGAKRCILIKGRIDMDATAGFVTLQWAQANLEVSNTEVHNGSYLIVHNTAGT